MSDSQPFEARNEGDVLIMSLCGRTGSLPDEVVLHGCRLVEERVQEPSFSGVVVDFSHMPYFGSMVLEALRNFWVHLRPSGRRMALFGVNDVGREILELARFDTIWPICATQEDAIKAVRGAA